MEKSQFLKSVATAARAARNELSPMLQKDWSTMRDPRRTVVMAHTNSNSARARRWYRVAEACEFEGEFFLHRDWLKSSVHESPETVGASPASRSEAIKRAKAHALETGNPYVPGTFSGFYGSPLRRA